MMEEKKKVRLLCLLTVWQRIGETNVNINDGTHSMQGKFLRFTGKRKLRLYISNKQQYDIDVREINDIIFTNKKSYRIDMEILLNNGNTIYIEAN